MKKKIAILGSTGSIGKNALSVIRDHSESFEVSALTANVNIKGLKEQICEFKPSFAALTGYDVKPIGLGGCSEISFGKDSILEACLNADIVLLSVTGIAGLPAFEFCLKNNIPVALATKEAMVCGGRLARRLMDETKTPVLPVDSELSAIWQCLWGNNKKSIKKVLLTASGGPFRTWSKQRILSAGIGDALNHPNWNMGKKITVDCASMANKGLEIMETRWLFDIEPAKISVVVHPESIIHSMVEYEDNAIMAQLGDKDMRIPIMNAFSYPERLSNSAESIDLFDIGVLHFEKPDLEKFPCLSLAYEAVKNDGELQLIFNCANEVAVEYFLNGKISFSQIYNIIENAMVKFSQIKVNNFDDIYEIDREVRSFLSYM